MGESGSRRSALVSRLPIFRRSSSKRQESLPSSPSSGGVGNGVHTSSPSSTNSSSGSTGKRRSLFRAPSLSFTAKRNSEPRVQPINLNLTPPLPQGTDANGNNQQTITASVSTGFSEGGGRPKSRHSFGFGSHKQKKITRSQTEDFEKASSSSSTNRNVFINCISGSGANEGDDSGFLDDFSGGSNNNRRSSRQKKQLLPKSFSAHHRFSRTSDHHRPPEVNLEPPSSAAAVAAPGAGGLTPGSWPGELLGAGGESSLQSPMISEDRTTAITPSEFMPMTEDSVSEVDVLPPAPTPASGLAPEPASEPGPAPDTADASPPEAPSAPENSNVVVSTSQVFFTPAQSSAEKPLLPDTSTANNTDYDTAVSLSEPETAVPCPPPQEQSVEERKEREEERKEASKEVSAETRREAAEERRAGYHTETTSESEACVVRSEGCHSNPEQSERRARHTLSVQERGNFCGCHEPRSSHLRKPHTASLCSSVSPYHEVMRMERRLRSSSEGAGGPRVHGNHREAPGMEGCGLLKHRNNSSSSKLGSLDVLNNLGSSELDEDDLMLDLDLSDDQRHRHVSREDSSQSLASCLNLLPSPMDPSGDRTVGKENNQREPSRPTTLLPADWSTGLGLAREEDPLPPGLETLPLRLMQQDCTAVKTLLLRLRRTLQESAETSPASSLQSLPISPCSEKSLPFKDLSREETLLQQLKEKDELIVRLQSELESAKAALKMKDCQMTDRTTQTEHMGPETSHPGRWSGLGSSSSSSSNLAPRDRRAMRGVGSAHAGDLSNQHLPHHCAPLHGRPAASERLTAREERYYQGALAQPSARNPVLNLAPGGSSNSSPATSAAPVQASPTTAAQLQVSHPGLGPNQCPGSASVAANHTSVQFLSSKQPERVSSSSESLTPGGGGGGGVSQSGGARRGGGGGGGGGDHHPPSHIPRAVAASVSSSLHSLASRGSPSPSVSSSEQASPPPPTPSSASSSSSSSSTFTGRLGQPPRGPLSLHSYSRKNVFLQHSLHTAELQALTQRDS
ncbi:serine-rich coiled-coil domain-containing protein 1 [Mugil cephalus]|uniref:serine-rich coiled-coil domain-containing protein 1 n=1 Tax=Mugil cephalus TaxID=48193 RepID=UPI001FB7DCA5|nr:serine-rich coiled-coil domain-containing protein 1 [Mugil cephalus]XP_047447446.1 serine-rich coiled-coil domain-containing protein 1 [Mugil cephalus]